MLRNYLDLSGPLHVQGAYHLIYFHLSLFSFHLFPSLSITLSVIYSLLFYSLSRSPVLYLHPLPLLSLSYSFFSFSFPLPRPHISLSISLLIFFIFLFSSSATHHISLPLSFTPSHSPPPFPCLFPNLKHSL